MECNLSTATKEQNKNEFELIDAVTQAFNTLPLSSVDDCFLTLMSVFSCAVKSKGGNSFRIPHLKKDRKRGDNGDTWLRSIAGPYHMEDNSRMEGNEAAVGDGENAEFVAAVEDGLVVPDVWVVGQPLEGVGKIAEV